MLLKIEGATDAVSLRKAVPGLVPTYRERVDLKRLQSSGIAFPQNANADRRLQICIALWRLPMNSLLDEMKSELGSFFRY